MKGTSKDKAKPEKTVTFPIYLWLLLPLGAFLWVFGEIDDSPGGMLLGVIAIAYFIHRGFRWIKSRKKINENSHGSQ